MGGSAKLERFVDVAIPSWKKGPHFSVIQREFFQIEGAVYFVHFIEADRSSPVIQGGDNGVFHGFFAAHSEDYLFELQRRVSQPALPDQTPFLLVSPTCRFSQQNSLVYLT